MAILNPFTFKRKTSCAWNALMAAYTFQNLSLDDQKNVKEKVAQIYKEVNGTNTSFDELNERTDPIAMNCFFSLAMERLSILPAIGSMLWFPIKNPFRDSIGAEEVLPTVKSQLEEEHGVIFPDLNALLNDWVRRNNG